MTNVLCKHCQSSCKRIGLVECEKYNAKANRPQQIQSKINNLFKQNKYDEARKLQEELFRLNHGQNSIDNARKEYNSLLVSGENNNRLEELKRRLDYLDWGKKSVKI